MFDKFYKFPIQFIKDKRTQLYEFQLKRKFNSIVKARNNNSFSQYLSLSKDIPISTFKPYETFSFNAFYGNSYVLKKYTGLSFKKHLKVSIQHGAYLKDSFWDVELLPPVHLTWGKNSADAGKKITTDPVYSIGAPFFYSESFLNNTQTKRERDRLGRNLLVFPVHSSHFNLAEYDPSYLIKKINRISDDFDSVRICLYWKDIQMGIHKHFEKKFEIVSAGHIFDMNFSSRLRSLIEICDATIANSIGSYVGYSIYLNKPFLLVEDKISRTYLEEFEKPKKSTVIHGNFPKMLEIFSQNEDFIISSEQNKIIEPFWGLKEIKEKARLLMYFKEADELWLNTHKEE